MAEWPGESHPGLSGGVLFPDGCRALSRPGDRVLIAVDTAGRWPAEVDVTALAKRAATTRGLQATEAEIGTYLSRVVLAGESPLSAFDDQKKAAVVPVFATAGLLVSFSGNYDDQWAYLDAIWNAVDAADQAPPALLPAMVLRFGRK